jgi:hypothetical protein
MNPVLATPVLALGLLLGLVACLEAGYRLGRKAFAAHPERSHEGIGAIEAALFALFGLLLGFSFAGATSRLDTRREQIVEEANAIGTSYLRLDLLASGEQGEMRRLFKEYLDARLAMYALLPDMAAADLERARGEGLQKEIWARAVQSSQADPAGAAGRLLLPALNDMMDLTTERTIALHTRLPGLILWLLISLALMSGLLAGYAMAKRHRRSWLHALVYAGFVAATIYAVLDLDNPRSGLIRLDAADRALVALRESIP